MLYPRVQRVFREKGPEGGLSLCRELYHRYGPAHRGPHLDRDAVPPGPGGPVRRLCRPGHHRPGRLSHPGHVPHGALLRGGLLPGGRFAGPGPVHRPGADVGGLQPGHHRLFSLLRPHLRHLRSGRGLSAGLAAPGADPAALPQGHGLSVPAHVRHQQRGDAQGLRPDGPGDGVHLGAAHQPGHQLPLRLTAV